MAITRKNVLLVLGLVAVISGGLLGAGAFSQVQADRQVSVTTAGDGAALLSMTVNDTYNGIASPSATGPNSEAIIEISLTDINDNAVTTFDEGMTIQNNGSNPVTLTFDTSSLSGITLTPATTTLQPGASTTVSIEVDTTGTVGGGTITITASTA